MIENNFNKKKLKSEIQKKLEARVEKHFEDSVATKQKALTALSEEIVRGIQNGVRKVNIDTDIRLAMTGAMRQLLAQQPGEFDPRKALIAARAAAQGICEARFEAFGCAGRGSKIKPISLEAIAKKYS